MSMTYQPLAFELELPWKSDEKQDEKFERLLKRILIFFLLLFFIMPWLKLVEQAYTEPDHVLVEAKVLLKPKPKPVPPPPVVSKPVEIKPIEKLIEPVEKPVEKPVQTPMKAPTAQKDDKPKAIAKAPNIDKKESIARAQGLSELSQQLNSLRGNVDVAKMRNKNVSESTIGTYATSDKTVLGAETAARKSGGIQVNDAAMKGDSIALATHYSTNVEGVIGGDALDGSQLSELSGQAGKRDMESIRRTLEQVKSNVYSLYQQSLLDNPDLAGKFTFKIVIQPDGSISDLRLISSELGIKKLESDILARIKRVNFGAKDVLPTTVEYKFVFLPS
jgi:hypothetical protein